MTHKSARPVAMTAVIIAAAVNLATGASLSSAAPTGSGFRLSGAPTTPSEEMAITAGQVTSAGKTLKYTAQAGLIPIYNDATGELMARLFIVAYTAERAPHQPPRPLTFIWNGGPGSSSSQVHLVGFGPKGFKTPETYPQWLTSPPAEIGDRPETWLAASDLVFVDPIGTGYSRATSERNRAILYTQRGDAEAVAEAIRIYRTRADAFDAPLFIAGESYGTTRAMEVAAALERRRTHLAGVILISGGYNTGQSVPPALNSALQISMYTATSHFHKRLPPDLQALSRDEAVQQAVTWARSAYAPALEKRDSLTPSERSTVVDGLVRYTGIDPQFIDNKTLVLDKEVFLDRLLDDRDMELGRYDSRMAFRRRNLEMSWAPNNDPSIKPMLDLMQGTSVPALRYIRNTLQYRSDLLYHGPFGEALHPLPLTQVQPGIYDDWTTLMWNRDAAPAADAQTVQKAAPEGAQSGAPQSAQPAPAQEASQRAGEQAAHRELPLRQAMEVNPRLLVFIVGGMFDGSCAARDEAVARTDAQFRGRVRNGCYAAGHMVYTDAEVRKALQHDFIKFVHDAVDGRSQR